MRFPSGCGPSQRIIRSGKEELGRERFKTVPYKYVEDADDDPGMHRAALPTKLAEESELAYKKGRSHGI
jgi:hypothetical protein